MSAYCNLLKKMFPLGQPKLSSYVAAASTPGQPDPGDDDDAADDDAAAAAASIGGLSPTNGFSSGVIQGPLVPTTVSVGDRFEYVGHHLSPGRVVCRRLAHNDVWELEWIAGANIGQTIRRLERDLLNTKFWQRCLPAATAVTAQQPAADLVMPGDQFVRLTGTLAGSRVVVEKTRRTTTTTSGVALASTCDVKWLDGPRKGNSSITHTEAYMLDGTHWRHIRVQMPDFIPIAFENEFREAPSAPPTVVAAETDPCWRCYTGDRELKHSCGPDAVGKFDPDVKPGRAHNVRITGLR